MSMDTFREPLPARPFWQRALPWVAGLVLAAGVAGVLVKIVPNSNPKADTSPTKNPTIVPSKAPNTVPLSKEARRVAGRFILTAVRREHLDEAWKLSGPLIRQDLTYKEWMTGSIPVVPFTAPIGLTPMKIDYSFRNHALVEVSLLPVKGSKVKPETFWLELKRVGSGKNARWLVWSWVPRAAPPIPANPVG
jgi:hypothetical protein